MRLAKHLAHSGLASRRACEALIAQGRVTVGGQIVRDPARDVTAAEAIAVDGRLVAGFEAPAVYALNKPVGVLSTASDPHGRPTVVQLLAHERRRLYPVGRLDLDSEGLLLLTNDGQLAHLLTHPRFEVPKTYRAWVSCGPVGERTLQTLREGLTLQDGPTAPAQVSALGPDEIEITIREGRNRQVRRMCDAVGHPVRRLRRVRFGPLTLDDLAVGEHRLLAEAEVQALRDAASTPPRHAGAL
jgi:23S rRNA pseudouridine2605 synthase